ncbi:MAG TPA: TolC family protein [Kiritimatiellia bacterium]|nr:TolC family protein [Kiritimatiellia bacterium]
MPAIRIFLSVFLILFPVLTRALTIEEALARARHHHPAILAANASAQAIVHEQLLSIRWPNPALDLEVEGLGGDREYTAMIQQGLTRPSHQNRQRMLGAYAKRAAEVSMVAALRDVEVALQKAFIEVLASREILKTKKDQLEIAERLLDTIRTKYSAGVVSELDILQADMALMSSRMEVRECEMALALKQRELATLIGGDFPMVGNLSGEFFQSLENSTASGSPEHHPAFVRAGILVSQAEVGLEQASAGLLAGISLGVGVRYEDVSNESTVLVAASVPLPLFSRGRHAVRPASWRVEAARAEAELAGRDVKRQHDEIVNAYESAHMQLTGYRDHLIPMAEKAFAVCHQGYEAGRRSSLELLAARQTLSEMYMRYIEKQRDVHMAAIEMQWFVEFETEQ